MAGGRLWKQIGLARPEARARLKAALVGGQLGGGVLLAVLGAGAAVVHRPLLLPLQGLASLFLGERALTQPGAGGLLAGLVAHQLGPVLFWSLVFGWVCVTAEKRPSLNDSLMLGFLLGGMAEILDMHLLMPALQHAVSGRDLWALSVPRLWDWLAHLAYGLTLGGCSWWLLGRRAAAARRGPEAPVP